MNRVKKAFHLRFSDRPAVVEWLEEHHCIPREHITGYADGSIDVMLWGLDESDISDIIAFKLEFSDRLIQR